MLPLNATLRWAPLNGAIAKIGSSVCCHCKCNKTVSDLAVSIQELIVEANKRLEEVGFDPSGRFNGHLRAVLEHRDRKLRARHACQPQTKVSVYLHVYMHVCMCKCVCVCRGGGAGWNSTLLPVNLHTTYSLFILNFSFYNGYSNHYNNLVSR